MTARRLLAATLLAAVATLSGCTAGYWIAGAPASRHAAAASPLLARRCANCHVVPDPAAMSAAAWKAALERMKVRVRLPASEWDSLATMAGGRVLP